MIDRFVVWTPGELAGLTRPLCTPQYPASSIVIHHTCPGTTPGPSDSETPQGIHRHHLAAGYGGIGYHYLIDPEGDMWRGRPVWARGAHCRANNAGRIGVALMGNYAAVTPAPAMIRSLINLLEDVQRVYGRLPVLAHRDVPGSSTECPGDACMAALERAGIKWGEA